MKAVWVGVSGTWRKAEGAYVGDDGDWLSGFSTPPVTPTSLSLRVCRFPKFPNDPVPSDWNAIASWTRAATDSARPAIVEWYVAPTIGGTLALVATQNVGSANSAGYVVSCPEGQTRDVRFRVRIGLDVGEHSDWASSTIRPADHNNRDPWCGEDPI